MMRGLKTPVIGVPQSINHPLFLQDAKTWTSDAKRAAKERREAKQKDGTDKGDKEIKVEANVAANVIPAAIVTENAPAGNGANPVATIAMAITNTIATNPPVDVKPPTTTPPEAAPVPAPTEPEPAEPPKPKTEAVEKPAELPAPFPTEEEEKKKEVKEEEKEKATEEEETKTEPESKTKEDEAEPEPEGEADKEEQSDKTDKKKADKVEKDAPLAVTRPRRTSKRRGLPLSGSPPGKTAKKGSEDIVDSTNDAVRGLHLLSQAVARDKKSTAARG